MALDSIGSPRFKHRFKHRFWERLLALLARRQLMLNGSWRTLNTKCFEDCCSSVGAAFGFFFVCIRMKIRHWLLMDYGGQADDLLAAYHSVVQVLLLPYEYL